MKGNCIVIPEDTLVQVSCKANKGNIDEVRPMIYNSSREPNLEGLYVQIMWCT